MFRIRVYRERKNKERGEWSRRTYLEINSNCGNKHIAWKFFEMMVALITSLVAMGVPVVFIICR